MSNTKSTIEIPVEMTGWRSDGVVLNPSNGLERSYVIDLLRMKETKSVKLVIEQEEEKVIQMTESEFMKLIDVVENYVHPAAELKSRLAHKYYHKRD